MMTLRGPFGLSGDPGVDEFAGETRLWGSVRVNGLGCRTLEPVSFEDFLDRDILDRAILRCVVVFCWFWWTKWKMMNMKKRFCYRLNVEKGEHINVGEGGMRKDEGEKGLT